MHYWIQLFLRVLIGKNIPEQKAFLVIHRVDGCSLHVNQNLLRPTGGRSRVVVFEEDGAPTPYCCLHPLKTFSDDRQ